MSLQFLSPGQIPDALPDASAPQEWRENLNVQLICPECQEFPPNIVENFSSGDTICASCGLVLGDRIVDTRSEWRTFANDENGSDDPSRVGNAADPLLQGSQLETHIAWGDGNARARELHRAHAKLATDSNNKTLKEAYSKIATFCAHMHLTDDAIRMAQEVFKDVHEHKSFKGKNVNNTLAGCIFIACRRTKHDRTFKDITDATGVSKKDTGRAFKAIEHFSREKKKSQIRDAQAAGTTVLQALDDGHTSTDPASLSERYCQELLLPRLPTRVAEEMAKKLVSTGIIAGRSPISIAAVAVYFASHLMGHGKSAKEIANVASVSDGTIRTSYKPVYAQRESLVEKKWLDDGGKLDRLPGA